MQRYRKALRTDQSVATTEVRVFTTMTPDDAGEWVRFRDVPVPPDTLLEEIRRDRDALGNAFDAAVEGGDRAIAERDISRRDACAAEERFERCAAHADAMREQILQAREGRGRAEAERDAALKLAEERSLAAGRAEEALLADGRVIQALNVQCEAEKVTIADLQSELRAWQRSDRLWREAALEAQKQLREARQASPTRVLPSPPAQPLHITETEEWQRGFKLGMKLGKKDGLDEAGAPLDGWSY
jgi:hypothetical protein